MTCSGVPGLNVLGQLKLATKQGSLGSNPAGCSSIDGTTLNDIDTGINHVDQGIRASAMREAVAALQADPNLRAAMFGTRPGMKGGIFGTLVEGMDTERAEEMLFYVAIGARDSQVRNDAATLIQQVAMAGTRRDG